MCDFQNQSAGSKTPFWLVLRNIFIYNRHVNIRVPVNRSVSATEAALIQIQSRYRKNKLRVYLMCSDDVRLEPLAS